MALKVKHLMTVDDLEAIPDDEWHRFELIEGELYVSCAPGLPHRIQEPRRGVVLVGHQLLRPLPVRANDHAAAGLRMHTAGKSVWSTHIDCSRR